MEVKILGMGCPKCRRVEELARQAAAEADIQAIFTKVKDMDQIMNYSIVSTPGLVIDGEVKSSGRIPRKKEIMAWMVEAQG
jgi:small redox-active disulfide protein 2